MRVRTRKLLGTIALLVFLLFYVIAAGAIGSGRINQAGPLIQFTFFLLAGVLWVVPARLLIRWMQRPD